MAIKYIFREDAILPIQDKKNADAQKIGEALADIAERSGGHLIPNAVVDAAKNERSVLHRHFEWDDGIAAEKFRIDQARSIIQSIRLVDKRAEEGTIRAFVSIRDEIGTSYRSLDSVMGSVDLQARVLAAAERDLLAFETRYRDLSEICDLVRTAREKVSARRKAAEKRPAEIR